MNNKKRTVLTSVLSLLFCVALCVGTTFAFFSDSLISKSNKVQAGTLKVDLQLLNKGTTDQWKSIKENKDPLFSEDILWEPGYTDVKVLRVVNNGDLSIQWEARFASQTPLTDLADAFEVYYVVVHPDPNNPNTTSLTYPNSRTDLLTQWTKMTFVDFVNNINQILKGNLPGGKSAYFGIALRMKPEAGNEYQGLAIDAFDIQILATQRSDESDFFGNDYDQDATLPERVCILGEHIESDEWVIIQDATLTETGVKAKLCVACEKVLVEESIPVKSSYSYAINDSGEGNSTVTLTKWDVNSPITNAVIPDYIDGKPVTAIADQAFVAFVGAGLVTNDAITSITLPDTLVTIGNLALAGLLIEEITIPDSVTTIYGGALCYCTELKRVTLPVNITIADQVFKTCTSLVEIHYAGTMEQWKTKSATFGWEWNANTGNYIVYCSDGNLDKSGNPV